MKIVNYFFSLILFFSIIQIGFAQKPIENGYIKMEVTDVFSENEQMMAMSGMLKGSFTEVYFTPEKSYTIANMMGGMSETVVLMDYAKKEHTMLMSMMGQKWKINMDESELKEMQSGGNEINNVSYKHFKDDTKEILGFKCHKVEMRMEENSDINMSFYITEEIKSSAHITSGVEMEALKGFPLEYVVSMGGQLDMTMTATDFKKDVDESVFTLDATGYKDVTLKELQEVMGGMGGM